jgi:hypothetical protein
MKAYEENLEARMNQKQGRELKNPDYIKASAEEI